MYIPSTYFRMAHLWVREEVQKKPGNIVPFLTNQVGGSKKEKRQTSILEKYFFREQVESF